MDVSAVDDNSSQYLEHDNGIYVGLNKEWNYSTQYRNPGYQSGCNLMGGVGGNPFSGYSSIGAIEESWSREWYTPSASRAIVMRGNGGTSGGLKYTGLAALSVKDAVWGRSNQIDAFCVTNTHNTAFTDTSEGAWRNRSSDETLLILKYGDDILVDNPRLTVTKVDSTGTNDIPRSGSTYDGTTLTFTDWNDVATMNAIGTNGERILGHNVVIGDKYYDLESSGMGSSLVTFSPTDFLTNMSLANTSTGKWNVKTVDGQKKGLRGWSNTNKIYYNVVYGYSKKINFNVNIDMDEPLYPTVIPDITVYGYNNGYDDSLGYTNSFEELYITINSSSEDIFVDGYKIPKETLPVTLLAPNVINGETWAAPLQRAADAPWTFVDVSDLTGDSVAVTTRTGQNYNLRPTLDDKDKTFIVISSYGGVEEVSNVTVNGVSIPSSQLQDFSNGFYVPISDGYNLIEYDYIRNGHSYTNSYKFVYKVPGSNYIPWFNSIKDPVNLDIIRNGEVIYTMSDINMNWNGYLSTISSFGGSSQKFLFNTAITALASSNYNNSPVTNLNDRFLATNDKGTVVLDVVLGDTITHTVTDNAPLGSVYAFQFDMDYWSYSGIAELVSSEGLNQNYTVFNNGEKNIYFSPRLNYGITWRENTIYAAVTFPAQMIELSNYGNGSEVTGICFAETDNVTTIQPSRSSKLQDIYLFPLNPQPTHLNYCSAPGLNLNLNSDNPDVGIGPDVVVNCGSSAPNGGYYSATGDTIDNIVVTVYTYNQKGGTLENTEVVVDATLVGSESYYEPYTYNFLDTKYYEIEAETFSSGTSIGIANSTVEFTDDSFLGGDVGILQYVDDSFEYDLVDGNNLFVSVNRNISLSSNVYGNLNSNSYIELLDSGNNAILYLDNNEIQNGTVRDIVMDTVGVYEISMLLDDGCQTILKTGTITVIESNPESQVITDFVNDCGQTEIEIQTRDNFPDIAEILVYTNNINSPIYTESVSGGDINWTSSTFYHDFSSYGSDVDIHVQVTDQMGNISTTTKNVLVNQTYTPEMYITSSDRTMTSTSSSISINYRAHTLGDVSSLKLYVDGLEVQSLFDNNTDYKLDNNRSTTISIDSLSYGLNVVSIEMVDSCGNTLTDNVNITLNTSPPYGYWSTTYISDCSESEILFSLRDYDNDITEVRFYTTDVNDPYYVLYNPVMDAIRSNNEFSFIHDFGLSSGSISSTMQITDAEGNIYNRSRTLYARTPTLYLNMDTSNRTVTSSSTTTIVQFDVESDSVIAELKLYRDGVEVADLYDSNLDYSSRKYNQQYTYDYSGLTSGVHVMEIRLEDACGNVLTDSFNLTFNEEAPVLTLTDGSDCGSSIVNIAAVDSNNNLSNVTVLDGSTEVLNESITGGSYNNSLDVGLGVGTHVLDVTVTDNWGNSTTDNITLTVVASETTALTVSDVGSNYTINSNGSVSVSASNAGSSLKRIVIKNNGSEVVNETLGGDFIEGTVSTNKKYATFNISGVNDSVYGIDDVKFQIEGNTGVDNSAYFYFYDDYYDVDGSASASGLNANTTYVLDSGTANLSQNVSLYGSDDPNITLYVDVDYWYDFTIDSIRAYFGTLQTINSLDDTYNVLLDAATNNIVVEITDSCGSVTSESLTINVSSEDCPDASLIDNGSGWSLANNQDVIQGNVVNYPIFVPGTDPAGSAIINTNYSAQDIDTSVPGSYTYTATITVTKSDGTPCFEEDRTYSINVLPCDPAPSISFSGRQNYNLGEAFEGVTYTVDGAGSFTPSGSVNTSAEGTYTLTAYAENGMGIGCPSTTETYDVTVAGCPPAPSVSFSGRQNYTVGESFEGVTYSVDGSGSFTPSGSVNTNVSGTYTLTATAANSAGSSCPSTTETYSVTVTCPGVNTAGSWSGNTSYVVGDSSFIAPIFTPSSGTVISTAGSVNINVAGSYTVTATIENPAGCDTANVSRTVTITACDPAPVITFSGRQNYNVGESFEGVTYFVDGVEMGYPIGTPAAAVDTSNTGTYTFSANADNPAGDSCPGSTETYVVTISCIPPASIAINADTKANWFIGEPVNTLDYTVTEDDGSVYSGEANWYVYRDGTLMLDSNVIGQNGNSNDLGGLSFASAGEYEFRVVADNGFDCQAESSSSVFFTVSCTVYNDAELGSWSGDDTFAAGSADVSDLPIFNPTQGVVGSYYTDDVDFNAEGTYDIISNIDIHDCEYTSTKSITIFCPPMTGSWSGSTSLPWGSGASDLPVYTPDFGAVVSTNITPPLISTLHIPGIKTVTYTISDSCMYTESIDVTIGCPTNSDVTGSWSKSSMLVDSPASELPVYTPSNTNFVVSGYDYTDVDLNSPGTYNVLANIDYYGCSLTKSMTLTVNCRPAPVINLVNLNVVLEPGEEGKDLYYTVTEADGSAYAGTNNDVNWTLDLDGVEIYSSSSIQQIFTSFHLIDEGLYEFEVVANNSNPNCSNSTVATATWIIECPTVTGTWSGDTEYVVGESVNLNANFTRGGAITYTNRNTFYSPGTYTVSATLTLGNDCTYTISEDVNYTCDVLTGTWSEDNKEYILGSDTPGTFVYPTFTPDNSNTSVTYDYSNVDFDNNGVYNVSSTVYNKPTGNSIWVVGGRINYRTSGGVSRIIKVDGDRGSIESNKRLVTLLYNNIESAQTYSLDVNTLVDDIESAGGTVDYVSAELVMLDSNSVVLGYNAMNWWGDPRDVNNVNGVYSPTISVSSGYSPSLNSDWNLGGRSYGVEGSELNPFIFENGISIGDTVDLDSIGFKPGWTPKNWDGTVLSSNNAVCPYEVFYNTIEVVCPTTSSGSWAGNTTMKAEVSSPVLPVYTPDLGIVVNYDSSNVNFNVPGIYTYYADVVISTCAIIKVPVNIEITCADMVGSWDQSNPYTYIIGDSSSFNDPLFTHDRTGAIVNYSYTPNLSLLQEGDYVKTITIEQYGCTWTSDITISVVCPPDVSVTKTWSGSSVVYVGGDSSDLPTLEASIGGDDLATLDGNTTITYDDSSIDYNVAGPYTLNATIDFNGCTYTSSTPITVICPAISGSWSGDSTLDFGVTASELPTFTPDMGSVVSDNSASIEFNEASPPTQTYTVTVEYYSCTETFSIPITIECPNNLNSVGSWSGDNTVPYGGDVSDLPVFNIKNGAAFNKYTATVNSDEVDFYVYGIQTLTATISDGEGCSYNDTIDILFECLEGDPTQETVTYDYTDIPAFPLPYDENNVDDTTYDISALVSRPCCSDDEFLNTVRFECPENMTGSWDSVTTLYYGVDLAPQSVDPFVPAEALPVFTPDFGEVIYDNSTAISSNIVGDVVTYTVRVKYDEYCEYDVSIQLEVLRPNYCHELEDHEVLWNSDNDISIYVLNDLYDPDGVVNELGLTAQARTNMGITYPVGYISSDDYTIVIDTIVVTSEVGTNTYVGPQSFLEVHTDGRYLVFMPSYLNAITANWENVSISYTVTDRNEEPMFICSKVSNLTIYRTLGNEAPIPDPMTEGAKIRFNNDLGTEIGSSVETDTDYLNNIASGGTSGSVSNINVTLDTLRDVTYLFTTPSGEKVSGMDAYYRVRSTSCYLIKGDASGMYSIYEDIYENSTVGDVREVTITGACDASNESYGINTCIAGTSGYYYTNIEATVTLSVIDKVMKNGYINVMGMQIDVQPTTGGSVNCIKVPCPPTAWMPSPEWRNEVLDSMDNP